MSQSPMPDSSWRGLPSWLFFAFLVFGPPASLVAFARTLTQDPFLISLVVLGYWTLLFAVHLVRKIWQPLEDPFTGYIAQWLTIHVKEMTSQYYRQYCRYVVAEHQVFDLKGLSTRTAHDLALQQVFVDLRLYPLPPHQASADPIRLPETLQGTHSIWEYLSNPTLSNSHLVILGAPGSGKTTLLKHLALTLTKPKKTSMRLRSHSFPILLFLRDHAQAIVDQPTFSLAKAVEEHIGRKWQLTIPTSWIQRYLERGKCLILLDGLDEVADREIRRAVVAWVQRQLIAYGVNRFVLTSRPYGYRENPLEGVTVLDIQAFTSDQVKCFIHNWYLANELKSWGKDDLSAQLHAQEGTQDLLSRLYQTPALLSLAVNPLLLTMIATVHRYRSSLPGKRVALYEEICEVFLGKRHEARGITHELSPAQKQQVLQPLAYWMMQCGKREASSEEAQQVIEPALAQVNAHMPSADFLRHIEETSGLLLEKNLGIYGFAHLTFQEYLTAIYLKEEGMESVLVNQVTNSWWHETIRLYCAQADATTVIQACLDVPPPSVEALVLAFECDEEKLKLQPQVQARLNALLKINLEDADPERRRIIAEVLLKRRLHRMIPLQQGTYIDTSLVTCAEYQVFLDEQQAYDHYLQPDHWRTFSFPKGAASTPVLGVRRSDAQAFCAWLTARDREGWQYRLPRTGEWSLEERTRWKTLYTETGYWTDDTLRFVWVQGSMPVALQQRLGISASGFDLDKLIATASDLVSARASARANTHTFALASASDSAFASALAKVRDSDLNRVLAFVNASALARISARDRNSNQAFAFAFASTSTFASALASASAFASSLVSARDCAISGNLDSEIVSNLVSASAIALDIQFSLHLLQGRIIEGLPAYEGILLVKERVLDDEKR